MGERVPLPIQSSLDPSLLGLPYTVREVIYIEILEWIGLELFLHVNTCPRCRDPRGMYQNSLSSLCAARIAQPEVLIPSNKTLAQNSTVNTIRFGNSETAKNPLPTLYNSSKKRRVHIATLLRYPTLLDLLATCRTIRQEVGELYWRRSSFHVGFDFGIQGYAVRPETFKHFLDVPFAGGPIYANVQRIALHFTRRDFGLPANSPEEEQRLSDLGDSLRYILESFLNLRHLKLYLSYGWLKRRTPTNRAPFNIALRSLKKAEKLTSVHICGLSEAKNSIMAYIFKEWRRGLKTSVTVSKSEESTIQDSLSLPACHTRVCRVSRPGDEDKDGPDDLIQLTGDGVEYKVQKGDVRYFLHSLKIPEITYLDTALFGDILMNPNSEIGRLVATPGLGVGGET